MCRIDEAARNEVPGKRGENAEKENEKNDGEASNAPSRKFGLVGLLLGRREICRLLRFVTVVLFAGRIHAKSGFTGIRAG